MIRRLTATLALATLLAAPIWLIISLVGNPILTSDQWNALRRTGTLDSASALKLGAGLFYLIWAWLAIVAASEIIQIRSGRPDSGPIRGWSPAGLVRRLVRLALATTTAAVIPLLSIPSTSVTAMATPAVRPERVTVTRAETSERVWQATGRDTALSVAIDVYGHDRHRDAIVTLNRGRSNPNGVSWTTGPFPPGMRVLLPPDAPTPERAPVDMVTIRSGDNLWNLAAERLDTADGPNLTPNDAEVAAYTDHIISVNESVFVEHGNPDLIYPGQTFAMPTLEMPTVPLATDEASPVPAQTVEPTTVTPPTTTQASNLAPPTIAPHNSTPATAALPPPTLNSDPVAPSTIPGTTATGQAIDNRARDDGQTSVPTLAKRIGWAGSATLAAGLLATAQLMRKKTVRRRQRPTEPARDINLALRTTPLLTTATWAADTLRGMPLPAITPNSTPAVLHVVEISDTGIEMLWNQPQPDLPDGWTSVNGGWSWTRTRQQPPGPPIGLAAHPALVTIGRRDGHDVLINLEASSLIELHGPNALNVARSKIGRAHV